MSNSATFFSAAFIYSIFSLCLSALDIPFEIESLKKLQGSDYLTKRDTLLLDQSFVAYIRNRGAATTAFEMALVARLDPQFDCMRDEIEREIKGARSSDSVEYDRERLDFKAFQPEFLNRFDLKRPRLSIRLLPPSPAKQDGFIQIGEQRVCGWEYAIRTALAIEFLEHNPGNLSANIRFWTAVCEIPTTRTQLVKWGEAQGLSSEVIANITEESLQKSNSFLRESLLLPGSLAGLVYYATAVQLLKPEQVQQARLALCDKTDEQSFIGLLIGSFAVPEFLAKEPSAPGGVAWYQLIINERRALHNVKTSFIELINWDSQNAVVQSKMPGRRGINANFSHLIDEEAMRTAVLAK